MKKSILFFALLSVFCAGFTFAGDGNIGLGIIIGEPTGISFKAWTSEKTAIDAAAAWSLDNKHSLHLHGDYLIHNFSIFKLDEGNGDLPLYFGIGGRMILIEDAGDDVVGIRIPIGLAYIPEKAPIDLFLEIVPVLDVTPDTEFDFEGAIGIRYFF